MKRAKCAIHVATHSACLTKPGSEAAGGAGPRKGVWTEAGGSLVHRRDGSGWVLRPICRCGQGRQREKGEQVCPGDPRGQNWDHWEKEAGRLT